METREKKHFTCSVKIEILPSTTKCLKNLFFFQKASFQCLIFLSRWYWQSAKYEPTPFQLHQLLTQPEPLTPGVKVNARKLTTYNKAHNFNLNGKIGGKLKTLLDVELEGVDTVSIEANLGDITKEEVYQPALMGALQSK